MPGIRTRTRDGEVALTLDACGGPGGGSGVDHDLLDLLRRHEVPATLFLNVRWIDANPAVAQELAADPLFELANHGKRHCPLTVRPRTAYGIRGTGSVGEVVDEVRAADDWFLEHVGERPRWFRSGTAHADDVAARVAERLGQPLAGFTVNADLGATASASQVARTLGGVGSGDIVIAHMNRPGGATAEGFARALPRLLRAKTSFVTLTNS
ncbi:polysaccharide deacetylase [Knoellia remsis]|uniref:Polysaccharide deacetylase n=1 Tax=Knoellia remsis TaxID=407159 RepID=A0A2T0UUG6_9MICO|nr:polysaccharide deacetylase [Knoellia remsis]